MGPPLPQFTAGLNLVRDWGSCLGNPSMPTIVLVTYLSQVALTIVLGVVLLHFYRQYRHDYLLQWCRSWWALAVYLGFGVLAFSISSQYAPLHPFRFLPMATALMAGYMSAGWLLFGTDQLATGSVPSTMRRRFILATLAGIGLLSGLLFTWDPAANFERFFVRIGLRSFVVGIAFLVAAWQVWRSRQVGPGAGRLGRGLVGASFGLYGLELLVYAGIGVEQLATHQGVSWVTYLGFIDFVLQTVMGLGMVIWLLEEERSKLVRASGQIEHLAYHDILTGLPNRLLFLDRLEVALAHARRTGGPVAVYFLDLDRFKIINDSLGHSTGDELLQLTAERLQRITRAGDTVARLGGDEFILLVRDIARTEALKLGRKLLEIIREPFALSAQELHVRTSIGVCLFPEDGVDAEALLKNADTAMYRAKETGRDTCCVYEAAMNERALERLALENDFRKAITNRELEAFYQPISHLATGRVVRAEALLRWRHPTRGLLLPGDFLSLAEVLGLTDAMDFHTLLTACRQAKAWRGSLAPELKVAVNVSARPFQRPDFASHVAEVLEITGLPAAALELEITETVAMQDVGATLRVLRELHRLGVAIAIDDFGTGHSSLSYLRHFPIQTLKLDQSFVRDLPVDKNAEAIAQSVIMLAHSMRVEVVAEGVETGPQLERLRALGCDYAQGYLFGRAVPPTDLARVFDTTQTAG